VKNFDGINPGTFQNTPQLVIGANGVDSFFAGLKNSQKEGAWIKRKESQLWPAPAKPGLLKIEGMVKVPVMTAAPKLSSAPFFIIPRAKQSKLKLFFHRTYAEKKVPVAAAVLALLIAFVAGMWSVLNTSSSIADNQTQVLADSAGQPNTAPQPPSGNPMSGALLQGQNDGSVSNNILFNTPIEDLQSYFQSPPEQPDVISLRKTQLAKFLADLHSPLAAASETIAEQSHWKLILAIAFAESSLGKSCLDNNCSNIGARPSAPSWRSYPSYSAWAVDFNRLLDKKYSDWTLEQMCGVYVKPCNPNWLLATQQILDQLKGQGIE
jgi:hypothetical protein